MILDEIIKVISTIVVFIFFMSVPAVFFAKLFAKEGSEPEFYHWAIALLLSIVGFFFVFGDNAGWY